MIKFFMSMIIVILLSISITFADYTQYRDEEKIEAYKVYIEKIAGEKIRKKNLEQRIDILVKIEKFLEIYSQKQKPYEEKKEYINILLAVQEYISSGLRIEEEVIKIRVIDDIRCGDCITDMLVNQLKLYPSLEGAEYEFVDFSDKGIPEYLQTNNIDFLPAIIFNHDNINEGDKDDLYLEKLPSKEYSLMVGAWFNPFDKISNRGFKLLDTKILENIKKDSYVLGNTNAEIVWIEYSDLECPFCARLHNSGVLTQLQEKYTTKLSYIFQHFPLDFHENAQTAAETMECIGKQYGVEMFYDMIEISYREMGNNDFGLERLYMLADGEGIITENISNCVEKKESFERVQAQTEGGMQNFDIRGTPGNVLINSITGEYKLLPGAYPYESFESIIEKLLIK